MLHYYRHNLPRALILLFPTIGLIFSKFEKRMLFILFLYQIHINLILQRTIGMSNATGETSSKILQVRMDSIIPTKKNGLM